MTYRGVVKGKTMELEELLPYCERQFMSVSVEHLCLEAHASPPTAIVKVIRDLPRLDPEDLDPL